MTQVTWTQPGPAHAPLDEPSLKSASPRHLDFDKAMQRLLGSVCDLMCLGPEWEQDGRVTGVSMSPEDEFGIGVVLTVQMAFAFGIGVQNTPRITFPAAQLTVEEEEDCSSGRRLVARLAIVQDEALAYARGDKRHDLFAAIAVQKDAQSASGASSD